MNDAMKGIFDELAAYARAREAATREIARLQEQSADLMLRRTSASPLAVERKRDSAKHYREVASRYAEAALRVERMKEDGQ